MANNLSTASSSECAYEHNGKRIAVIDFETDPFKHGRYPQAFAVGFFDGICYQSKWGTHEDCLSWASRKCRTFAGIIYAHNGGKFDFLAFLLATAGEAIWGEPVLCIGGRIVRMRYGEAELRDSYAILPAPLRAYDKGEIDYQKFEKNKRARYKPEILHYLSRDLRSLHSLVMAFISVHGLRPLTAASAAMKSARDMGIKVENFNDKQDAKFRKFYYGGLVLARKPGIHHGAFTLYDIKSAYPHAMLHAHAAGTTFDFSDSALDIRGESFVHFSGYAECFLRRTKEGNAYGGNGDFYITGWEYLAARNLGIASGRVNYVETPTETIDFKPYVNHHYEQKQEAENKGEKARRLIHKIMLNALYGKYAQRNDKFREYFIWPLHAKYPVPAGFTVESIWDESGFQVISKPSPHRGLYNVATAASITGFVRAMLMKAIDETDPYYCDTDSVIVESSLKPSNCGSVLGCWGCEVEGDCLAVAGKKLYALRLLRRYARTSKEARAHGYSWDGERAWKVASKGARLNPGEIMRICQGQSIHYKNDAPCYSLLNNPFFVKRTIKRTAIPSVVSKPKPNERTK